MSARTKLETFEEVYNRKLTAAEAYANRPRKWMLYTLIVLIIVVMVSWSSSSIQFNGMTTTGSEVAKGVLHGVFNPDTKLLFGTGDTDVPYLLLQTVAIAVLGTLFGAILAIPFAFLAASNIMPKPISYLFRLLILLIRVLRNYLRSGEVRQENRAAVESLAKALKGHRERCRMTQEFVAESIGVSRQAVSKWETGAADPSTANLLALAKLYGVSPEELLHNAQNGNT